MRKIGILLLLAGILAAIPVYTAETALIIRMGIRAFQAFSVLPPLFASSGAALLLTGVGKDLLAKHKRRLEERKVLEQQRENAKPVLSYTAASYDPEDIRRRLEGIARQRPDLEEAISRCHGQMDAMDRRQAKLKELLDLNGAEYLRNTETLLNEVEQFICKNFRKVINRCVVSDLGDDQVFSKDGHYATDLELIDAILLKNQTELDNIKKFLADLADLISEDNDNPETTLEIWMNIIRDSLNKEGDFLA